MDKPNVLSVQDLDSYFNARANFVSAQEEWENGMYKKSMFALAEYFVKKIYDRKFARIDSIGDVEKLDDKTVKVDFTYSGDGGSISTVCIPVCFLTGNWESVNEAIEAFKDYTKLKQFKLEEEHRKVCEEAKKQRSVEQEEEEKKEYIRLKKKFEVVNGKVVGRGTTV